MTEACEDTHPGFSGPVHVMQSGDVNWTVTVPFSYRSLAGRLVLVERGASTDGASVPRPCAWLVPRSGRYLPAAVAHDICYRRLVPSGQMGYREADAILLEAMRLLRVSFVLRWTIWCAVRLASLFRGREGRRDWRLDALRVLAILLCPTSWIAVVVSGVVAIALATWWIVESTAYLLLLAQGRSDRLVNPPHDIAKSG